MARWPIKIATGAAAEKGPLPRPKGWPGRISFDAVRGALQKNGGGIQRSRQVHPRGTLPIFGRPRRDRALGPGQRLTSRPARNRFRFYT